MPSFSNMFSSSFLKTKGLRYGTVIESLSSGALDTEIKKAMFSSGSRSVHFPSLKCN